MFLVMAWGNNINYSKRFNGILNVTKAILQYEIWQSQCEMILKLAAILCSCKWGISLLRIFFSTFCMSFKSMVTIPSPTGGTSRRLENRVSVLPWFLHSDYALLSRVWKKINLFQMFEILSTKCNHRAKSQIVLPTLDIYHNSYICNLVCFLVLNLNENLF